MDSNGGHIPVQATSFKLESDAEFIESIILHGGDGRSRGPLLEKGFSSRQLYLRSYTFTTKKDRSAIKRIKDKIKTRCRCGGGRKAPADSILRRLLSCTIKIDVLD